MIDQLQQFGETRRGWLGVRIQQVTDEIAESLGIKPARGALVAGVDDKGPAKPAGIEPGDVIVKFDGKDIKEMRDLPRIVADTPVGKDVEVVVIRKGKEEKHDRQARPARGRREAAAGVRQGRRRRPSKSVVQEDARPRARRPDRRPAQEVQDQGHREGRRHHSASMPTRPPPTSGSRAGDVIVEIAQEPVASAGRLPEPVEQLKKDGRKTALLLVASADGELRFVALSLQ